ncbi:MAG: SUF system Fe-S cluster assembly protein [Bacteroidota bacterium]|nr:SUF system Fe-S cluster assembly protein [Bacteroidota bacterium]
MAIPNQDQVIEVLKTIFDPEIPVDIYELGLIYEVKISAEGDVDIDMTLTSPNCPVAESLPKEVEDKVAEMEGVESAKVQIVFDPPWTQDMMSEAAKLECGFL